MSKTQSAAAPADQSAGKEPRFFNRELSWLAFNQRVLNEALDPNLPLLERLKFLAITASNLDEFFMVRVGGLSLLARQGRSKTDPAGMTPSEQLEAVIGVAQKMMRDQYACYVEDLEPALAAQGIRRLTPEKLTERQAEAVEHIFANEIFPVATPMAVDPDQEFPLLANQTLHACIRLAERDGEPRMAIMPLGCSINRLLTLPTDGADGYVYLLVEDAVRMFVSRFFPGEEVEECVTFRLTRNADFAVDDDGVADLLSEMQEVLDARKQGHCVWLEVDRQASPQTLEFLRQGLMLDVQQVFAAPGPLNLAAFMLLCGLTGFNSLRYRPWRPQPPPEVDDNDMFAVLARRDVLLHHPYDSFEPVVQLVRQAALDPDVLAIKQTMYRTSADSPIVAALRTAAERGKYVTALVELKARFDEARNIEWARSLEQAGAQVIYGVRGLKTHAKVSVIVRREPGGTRRYVHFGTGNYNEKTARLYTDVSYMTSDEELGADASRFFNAITGYSQPLRFHRLEAAPMGLRERLMELIEGETRRKRQGQKAHIVAKMNSLVDPQIIRALYAASQAGVKVKLNVRGICCLRPGVAGLSENIEVVSIVDRFLEHSRIFYFFHGGDELLFISSADWMPRNLDRRVELMAPVDDTASRHKLLNVLDTCFRDNTKASLLLPSGQYVRKQTEGPAVRCQAALYQQAQEAAAQAERALLSPHRPPSENSIP